MLDMNVTVYYDSQYFETPRENNHSETAPKFHIVFGSDTLHFPHNSTTRMTGQKLPPYGS